MAGMIKKKYRGSLEKVHEWRVLLCKTTGALLKDCRSKGYRAIRAADLRTNERD